MSGAHPDPASGSGAEQAAQAIVELINSRPRSPRREEIAAIIKKLAIARPPASCSHCDDPYREYGPATRPSP